MDNIFDELIDDMVEENKRKEDLEKIQAEAQYHAEKKAKFKTHTFTSANKWYLIAGCFFALTAIILEILAFSYVPFVIGCFLQIPVSSHNKPYSRTVHKGNIFKVQYQQSRHIKFYCRVYCFSHFFCCVVVKFARQIRRYNFTRYADFDRHKFSS